MLFKADHSSGDYLVNTNKSNQMKGQLFTFIIRQQKPMLNHGERISLQDLTQELQHLTEREREREIYQQLIPTN